MNACIGSPNRTNGKKNGGKSMADRLFVTHTCRNPKCERAFMDYDVSNAQSFPPSSKYCLSCQLEGLEQKKDPKKVRRGKYLGSLAKIKNGKVDIDELLEDL